MPQLLRPGERTGPDGKPVANQVLLSLTPQQFRLLRPHLQLVPMAHHNVLHESHRKATVYFPNDGLISLVIVMANGKSSEAGVVGSEGVFGLEGL
jgi:hypothetical protein